MSAGSDERRLKHLRRRRVVAAERFCGLHTSRLFDCNVSLLQLRYPQWSSAAEVKEERTFLFGQEGGGDHVVDSRRELLGLHITEATSEDEEEKMGLLKAQEQKERFGSKTQ